MKTGDQLKRLLMWSVRGLWGLFKIIILLQVSVESSSAVNVTLPAYAADRWRLQHNTHSYLSVIPAHRTLSSKQPPTAVDWWDRRTDDRPLHRPCSAYCVGSINNTVYNNNIEQILVGRQEGREQHASGKSVDYSNKQNSIWISGILNSVSRYIIDLNYFSNTKIAH